MMLHWKSFRRLCVSRKAAAAAAADAGRAAGAAESGVSAAAAAEGRGRGQRSGGEQPRRRCEEDRIFAIFEVGLTLAPLH